MFTIGKELSRQGMAVSEVMFWRQFVSLPVMLGWLAWRGELSRLRTERIFIHARRSALGMSGLTFNFLALTMLPLAEWTALTFTAPLFTVIISGLILRHHVGPWRWTAVLFGFAGVLVIAQPGHSHMPMLGAIAGLLAGLFGAIVTIQVKDLSRTEESLTVVFYFAVFGSLFTAVFLPFTATSHTLWQWGLIVAMGLVGMVGQIFLTAALRFGAMASVVVMDYSQLIWASLFGWLLTSQLPLSTTWLGAPLIVAAGVVITWREERARRIMARTGVLEIQ